MTALGALCGSWPLCVVRRSRGQARGHSHTSKRVLVLGRRAEAVCGDGRAAAWMVPANSSRNTARSTSIAASVSADGIIAALRNLCLSPSSARLGPYEILSAIGAGGTGEVFLAHDTRLDRDVAIIRSSDRRASLSMGSLSGAGNTERYFFVIIHRISNGERGIRSLAALCLQ